MSKMTVNFESHKGDIDKSLHDQIRAALTIIGGKAEGYAKKLCPWDTGLLRNSITYALDGEPAQAGSYRSDTGVTGSYEGIASSEKTDTVIIGTNVEYAPFIELGHHTRSGSWIDAREFLQPAIRDHMTEYKEVVERILKK